jgi:hypothetical protein
MYFFLLYSHCVIRNDHKLLPYFPNRITFQKLRILGCFIYNLATEKYSYTTLQESCFQVVVFKVSFQEFILSGSHILLGDSPVWQRNAGEIIKLSFCSVTFCVLCCSYSGNTFLQRVWKYYFRINSASELTTVHRLLTSLGRKIVWSLYNLRIPGLQARTQNFNAGLGGWGL